MAQYGSDPYECPSTLWVYSAPIQVCIHHYAPYMVCHEYASLLLSLRIYAHIRIYMYIHMCTYAQYSLCSCIKYCT